MLIKCIGSYFYFYFIGSDHGLIYLILLFLKNIIYELLGYYHLFSFAAFKVSAYFVLYICYNFILALLILEIFLIVYYKLFFLYFFNYEKCSFIFFIMLNISICYLIDIVYLGFSLYYMIFYMVSYLIVPSI